MHTHHATGHALRGPTCRPGPGVQLDRTGARAETVTLLHATPDAIGLAGWQLIDRAEQTQVLAGIIEPGATRVVTIAPPLGLGNNGATIALVDARGAYGRWHRLHDGRRFRQGPDPRLLSDAVREPRTLSVRARSARTVGDPYSGETYSYTLAAWKYNAER